ncbi:TRAP transporter small permease [Bacillus sp. Marseille-P3661]|uniref:TRAP transporter small permease n=1 Tax=Bacillus sp. Marseille-P3661 TaxID=1936234 RepID=UPI000C8153CB|nr:TRAP transporter small permease [Bacillus sp. Marseille-P3661]
MGKLINFINGINQKILIVVGIAMTVVIVAQVICRTFLGFSIYWSEEFARYCLIWMTFLGASVAYSQAELAFLDILENKFKGKSKWILQLLVELCVLFFIVICIYYGLKQTFAPSTLNKVSPAMRLPMVFVYSSVPISFSFMFLQSLNSIINILPISKKGGKTECQQLSS